jgi:hypothetical protein
MLDEVISIGSHRQAPNKTSQIALPDVEGFRLTTVNRASIAVHGAQKGMALQIGGICIRANRPQM